jgi:DNA-binding transcriptional MocR family regulator
MPVNSFENYPMSWKPDKSILKRPFYLSTYSNFIELSKMLYIQLVPISGDENGIRPDELENQCRQSDIHGIFLMPSYCNPTSIIISMHRNKDWAKVIKKFGLIAIEDDIHAF